jgi:hypothetical protein
MRLHHFVPGIGVLLAAGGTAVLLRTAGNELRFAVPYGVGAELVLDELGLLLDLDNPYWRTEWLALSKAAAAGLAAAVLGLRFVSRGSAH